MAKAEPMLRFQNLYRVSEHRYNGTSCWDWLGWITLDGYGMFMNEHQRDVPAMRWICMQRGIAFGVNEVPDHLCRRRNCVNPEHAEKVTVAENNRRGVGWAGINAQKTHCLRGHEFTPENTYNPPHIPHGRSCRACKATRERNRRKVPV